MDTLTSQAPSLLNAHVQKANRVGKNKQNRNNRNNASKGIKGNNHQNLGMPVLGDFHAPGADVADAWTWPHGQREGTSAAAILAEIPFSPMKTPNTQNAHQRKVVIAGTRTKDPALLRSQTHPSLRSRQHIPVDDHKAEPAQTLSSTSNCALIRDLLFPRDMESLMLPGGSWICQVCIAPTSQHWRKQPTSNNKNGATKGSKKSTFVQRFDFQKESTGRRMWFQIMPGAWYRKDLCQWIQWKYQVLGNLILSPRQHLPGLGTVAEMRSTQTNYLQLDNSIKI